MLHLRLAFLNRMPQHFLKSVDLKLSELNLFNQSANVVGITVDSTAL